MGSLLLAIVVVGGITSGVIAEFSPRVNGEWILSKCVALVAVLVVAATVGIGIGTYIYSTTASEAIEYDERGAPVVLKAHNTWSGATAGIIGYLVVGWGLGAPVSSRIGRS